MDKKTILTFSEAEYNHLLNLVATELSKINKSDFNLELSQLAEINPIELHICILANQTSQYFENHQYEDDERELRNKEIDDHLNYLLDYNNLINSTDEELSNIIEEWIEIFNATRLTYSHDIMRKLKQLRLERKLTQQNLADYLGITYQAYAHYEKGRRMPDINTLIKLSYFYRVSLDYIFDMGKKEVLSDMLHRTKRINHAKVMMTRYTSHFIKKLFDEDVTDIQLYNLSSDNVKVLANMIKQLTKQS